MGQVFIQVLVGKDYTEMCLVQQLVKST